MHAHPARSLAILSLAIAACSPVNPGAPLMPGSVNAPPPPMAAAGDALLTDTLWSWKETVMSDGKRISPDVPGRYTVLFQAGGKVAVQADCNRGTGTYALNGSALLRSDRTDARDVPVGFAGRGIRGCARRRVRASHSRQRTGADAEGRLGLDALHHTSAIASEA